MPRRNRPCSVGRVDNYQNVYQLSARTDRKRAACPSIVKDDGIPGRLVVQGTGVCVVRYQLVDGTGDTVQNGSAPKSRVFYAIKPEKSRRAPKRYFDEWITPEEFRRGVYEPMVTQHPEETMISRFDDGRLTRQLLLSAVHGQRMGTWEQSPTTPHPYTRSHAYALNRLVTQHAKDKQKVFIFNTSQSEFPSMEDPATYLDVLADYWKSSFVYLFYEQDYPHGYLAPQDHIFIQIITFRDNEIKSEWGTLPLEKYETGKLTWMCHSAITTSGSDMSKLDCYDEDFRSVTKSWGDYTYQKVFSLATSGRTAEIIHMILQDHISKEAPKELPDLFEIGEVGPIQVHSAQFQRHNLNSVTVVVSGATVTLRNTFAFLGEGSYGSVVRYAEFINDKPTGRMYAIKSTHVDEDVAIRRLRDDFCDAVPTRKLEFSGKKPIKFFFLMRQMHGTLLDLRNALHALYPEDVGGKQQQKMEIFVHIANQVRAQLMCMYRYTGVPYMDTKLSNVLYSLPDGESELTHENAKRVQIHVADLGSLILDDGDTLVSSFPPPECPGSGLIEIALHPECQEDGSPSQRDQTREYDCTRDQDVLVTQQHLRMLSWQIGIVLLRLVETADARMQSPFQDTHALHFSSHRIGRYYTEGFYAKHACYKLATFYGRESMLSTLLDISPKKRLDVTKPLEMPTATMDASTVWLDRELDFLNSRNILPEPWIAARSRTDQSIYYIDERGIKENTWIIDGSYAV